MCDFDLKSECSFFTLKAFQVEFEIRKARPNFEVSLLTLETEIKHIVLQE